MSDALKYQVAFENIKKDIETLEERLKECRSILEFIIIGVDSIQETPPTVYRDNVWERGSEIIGEEKMNELFVAGLEVSSRAFFDDDEE